MVVSQNGNDQTLTSSQAVGNNQEGNENNTGIVKNTDDDTDARSDTSAFESDGQMAATNGDMEKSTTEIPVANVDDNVINILPQDSSMDSSTGKIILSNATALVKGNGTTVELTQDVVDEVCQFLEAEPIEFFLCNVPAQPTEKPNTDDLTNDASKDHEVDETLNGDDESPSKKIRIDETEKQVEVSQVGYKDKLVCKV